MHVDISLQCFDEQFSIKYIYMKYKCIENTYKHVKIEENLYLYIGYIMTDLI